MYRGRSVVHRGGVDRAVRLPGQRRAAGSGHRRLHDGVHDRRATRDHRRRLGRAVGGHHVPRRPRREARPPPVVAERVRSDRVGVPQRLRHLLPIADRAGDGGQRVVDERPPAGDPERDHARRSGGGELGRWPHLAAARRRPEPTAGGARFRDRHDGQDGPTYGDPVRRASPRGRRARSWDAHADVPLLCFARLGCRATRGGRRHRRRLRDDVSELAGDPGRDEGPAVLAVRSVRDRASRARDRAAER